MRSDLLRGEESSRVLEGRLNSSLENTHTQTEVIANFVDYVQFFFRFQWSVVIQITLELIFNAIYTL